MKTRLLRDCAEGLLTAAELLRRGEVVGMPTETVYGLAADCRNEAAVRKIFEAKGRPADNPLIVHIAALEDMERAACQVPPLAQRLAEQFMPGPLTLVLPKRAEIPYVTSGGLDTVGIRFPAHPAAQALIRLSGCLLAAPSANRSGYPSPTTAQHVLHDMEGRIPAVLDAGACAIGIESTVVSFDDAQTVRILRPGGITAEMLRTAAPCVVIDPAITAPLAEGETARSPGMKYRHYAPGARVILVDSTLEQFRALTADVPPRTYALVFDGETGMGCPALSYGGDAAEQAHLLFARLRELDTLGAELVYVRMPSKEGVGLGVYNRLIRAAGFEVMHL